MTVFLTTAVSVDTAFVTVDGVGVVVEVYVSITVCADGSIM